MPFQPMQQQPVNSDAGMQNNVPPAEQAEELFKQQFHQAAYSVLFSKFSDLAPNVVTFKIMHTKPEEGDGVGAFVLLYNNKPLYIPVVMTDGQLKPMDIVYYKELNMFLPLEKVWLDEIASMSVENMGEDVEIPQDVPRDMDVRPLIYPPITPGGRIGYASDMEHDVLKMYKESQDHHYVPKKHFLEIMRSAPRYLLDGVKMAFEKRPDLLQKFVRNYGVDALTSSMAMGYAKSAQVKKSTKGGSFQIFTKNTPASILKKAYGEKVGEAFSHILERGFIVNDTRKGICKIAIKVENSIRLEEPGLEGGWFRLYFVDGPAANYFIIPWPNVNRQASRFSSNVGGAPTRPLEYLCIREDGTEAFTETGVIGERIYDFDPIKDSKIYKLLGGTGDGETPKPDSYGFFIHSSQKNIEATEPEKIKFVISDDGMTKYVTQYGGPTYIIDDDPTRQYFESQARGEIVYLPKSTKWVELVSKVTDENDPTCCGSEAYYRQRKTSIIKDPKLLTRWMDSKLQKSEANPVKVKSAGFNQWWVEGTDRALFLHEALEKVACKYEISAKDAGGILVDAQENGISGVWILDNRARTKIAAEIYKMAQPPQEGPMQGQMPAQMDPNMMQPMAPPVPQVNPTNLAIGEAIQQLTQQNQLQMQQLQAQMQQSQQAMEMQQQNTQQLVGVLQGIQQRSNEISQATQGGSMLPPEAEASPAAAAEMVAPQPPPEEPPPPMPMMENDTPTPENIEQEINPEMIDQAETLQDEGVFDTAALSMLASSPALQDIVASYVPNMEKCVDNLGRVLLTLWLTEGETRSSLGDETFVMLEDKLRTVFKGLGDAILSISHNALASSSETLKNKRVSATMQ